MAHSLASNSDLSESIACLLPHPKDYEPSSSGMKVGSLKEDFLVEEGAVALHRLHGNVLWEKWVGMEHTKWRKEEKKTCTLPKSKVVEAQAKSGPTGREKARKTIILQNRTEMGTNVQDLESPAEEFVFYLVGDGEPPKVFLMRQLLIHRTGKLFWGALIILSLWLF